MNNAYAMSATLERKHNTEATMITAGFATFIILLMFFLKWQLPVFEKTIADTGIDVEITLPDEPPTAINGGGGGGNPVEASGPAGAAPYSPPAPGTDDDDAQDVDDNPDKSAPAIIKPDVPKPTATKVNSNNTKVNTPVKPVETPPAPPKPKAVIGKTIGGNNTGGGAANDYERSGGTGTGYGVGNGSGTGGGSGTGSGGGNGPGRGSGNGPSRVSGSRTVINPKPMDAGENIQGVIRAKISVSPDGIGTYISSVGGSLMSDRQAVQIVRDWLKRNRFNASSETTTEVYEFNIKLGG